MYRVEVYLNGERTFGENAHKFTTLEEAQEMEKYWKIYFENKNINKNIKVETKIEEVQ